MYDKTVLFAVGASLVIALGFVPASAATSTTDEASMNAVCVRFDPSEPALSVHQKCDHQGDLDAGNEERSWEDMRGILALG